VLLPVEERVRSEKFTYDPAANAAYLTLTQGEVAESRPVTNTSGNVELVVDVAADGRIVGIEFLDAARQLPGWVESRAERPDGPPAAGASRAGVQ
jgi:uncharacterized protein YuzE